MLFEKKGKEKEKGQRQCEICHKNPATTTMKGRAGVVQVCKECKKIVRI